MGQFEPLSTIFISPQRSQIKLVATDMDGTLTRQGQFTADLLQGLERLHQACIPVVIVTGRSAGWVQGVAHYLPVAGAMAENGGVYFAGVQATADLLADLPDISIHRQHLAAAFEQLQQRLPKLEPSRDNPFRLTDWTFDITGLTQADLDWLEQACQAAGFGFTYSTVQCHLYPPGQSKAAGLMQVLQQHFPNISPREVITLGDSPNDESLFNQALFPNAVGVANLKDYWDHLTHRPAYLTNGAEVDGFLELVEILLTQA
jgi:HAD superfamily hydrolase (TIGR01484 family)